MTITERIEGAITEKHRQMMKPTAVVLGPKEAGELRDWVISERLRDREAVRFKFLRMHELESLTYNGLLIRLSENDGIDILT